MSDIKKLKEDKIKMEQDIYKLITEFTEKWGVEIEDIEIYKMNDLCGNIIDYRVKISIKV